MWNHAHMQEHKVEYKKVECKQVNYTSQKLDSNLYFPSIHNSSIQFFPCFHCISRIHKCHKSKTLENTVRDHFPSHHFIVSDWFKIDRTFTLGFFFKITCLGLGLMTLKVLLCPHLFFFFLSKLRMCTLRTQVNSYFLSSHSLNNPIPKSFYSA